MSDPRQRGNGLIMDCPHYLTQKGWYGLIKCVTIPVNTVFDSEKRNRKQVIDA